MIPEPDKVKVYLVDDHPVVRAGLRAILEEYPVIKVIGEAGLGSVALKEIPSARPDVVLLDLRLPDQDGCELCCLLKALREPPRVLILTSFGGDDRILAAMGSGADGYLLKDNRDDVLVAAITMVASGGTVWPCLSDRDLGKGMPRGAAQPGGLLARLSPQELRVLAVLTEGKTNKEIAAHFGVSEKTVRNQVSSLMQKLGVERRAQAAACYARFHSLP